MKKRILLAGCLIVVLLLQAVAAAAPSPAAKQLMEQYTAAWEKVEAGIDYQGFGALNQELAAATQQFKEKYPHDAITEDFLYLRQLYADVAEIWSLKAEAGVRFLPKSGEQGKERGTSKYFIHTVMLRMNYPTVLDASLESKENGYFVNSVLDNLMGYAAAATQSAAAKLR